MSVKAIVPFKLHSKGLPNKLIMNFAGKKMYQWIIEAARDCPVVEQIYITGNLQEYKLIYPEIKTLYPDVEWLMRPKKLQDNSVELLEVMQFALKKIGKKGDVFVQLQANKPLTNTRLITDTIKAFNRGVEGTAVDDKIKYNSLFTVQRINTAVNWEYQANRQVAKRNLKSCAAVKIWDYTTLKSAEKGTWGMGKYNQNYVIPDHHWEIDTIEDFRIAECLKKGGY